LSKSHHIQHRYTIHHKKLIISIHSKRQTLITKAD
jgi:hypothetical protein